jgi:ATP-dependent exoDNAse (exonuclease V) beta subunit
MTVHRAKGLEFPVVILVDPTCRATHPQPSRHIDAMREQWLETLCGCAPPELIEASEEEQQRDHAEAVRLAYVAATRARDLLVMPVIGDEDGSAAGNGWIDMLRPAFYPETKDRRQPGAAPGCPAFGSDTVLDRPDSARAGVDTAVAPGNHRALSGTHSVVWWDPSVLELDREQDVGLRQQRILEADKDEVAANEGIRAHAEWQENRQKTLQTAAVESFRVSTVTQAPSGEQDIASRVELVKVAKRVVGRPSGKRFGALVHAVLAVADLDANEAAVEAVAAAQARLLGADASESEAASRAVLDALGHPLMKAAATAARQGELRRETPVLLQLDDGQLLEGVVDLAFRDGDAWTVIDFKTDRELGERVAEYERQVSVYAEAVARATGEPARAVLLVV